MHFLVLLSLDYSRKLAVPDWASVVREAAKHTKNETASSVDSRNFDRRDSRVQRNHRADLPPLRLLNHAFCSQFANCKLS